MTERHAIHRYRASCAWEGSTALGYDAYPRVHDLYCPPADVKIELSSDPVFLGDPAKLNPEQLLVGAASSCQLLSFLAVAARARIDVVAYRDDAEGEMSELKRPMAVDRIVLRPHITVAPGTDLGRLGDLVEAAHNQCFIANSLRTEIVVEPTFDVASGYAFRDGDPAAERLAMVARLFETPSREFVSAAISDFPSTPRLAVDLGCGPGHTTALLAEVTGAERVVGLDESEHFLDLARSNAKPGVTFVRHDLQSTRWPVASGSGAAADLAYGRLILAHLPDPAVVTLSWLGELAPGGRLLLDELEWIRTDEPVLQQYLELVTELVAAHGVAMFTGPFLAELDPSMLGRRTRSGVREWPVPVVDAAAMFALNLSVWRNDPAAGSMVASPAVFDRLATDLERLSDHGSKGRITWGLRQVVFERSG
jgi:organic hydroperoxide reductase OsmC/OhrA/SAM-dependent methyltransferase